MTHISKYVLIKWYVSQSEKEKQQMFNNMKMTMNYIRALNIRLLIKNTFKELSGNELLQNDIKEYDINKVFVINQNARLLIF
jgi:hypothetical protein